MTTAASVLSMLGITAGIVLGVLAWRQRDVSARRQEWWSREQWAIDVASSGDLRREPVGFRVLRVLSRSKLAGREEVAIFDAVWETLLLGIGVDLSDDGSDFVLIETETAEEGTS